MATRVNKITKKLLIKENKELFYKLVYLTDEPEIIKESAKEIEFRLTSLYKYIVKRLKIKNHINPIN